MIGERATAIIEPIGLGDRRTYTAFIYQTLHDLIQELALPPGERLVEADLAARFEVSKTPIREALLTLARDALVTIVPHVGATVSELSLEDYEQQIFLQDALEQPAMPLVVERITPHELSALGDIVDQIAEAHARGDMREYYQLGQRMHRQLFAAARYPRLLDLIGTVRQALRRYHPIFVQGFEENLLRERTIIEQRIAYVQAGDPVAAARAVQQGHAEMLDFARRLVDARHPAVCRYLTVSGTRRDQEDDRRFAAREGR